MTVRPTNPCAFLYQQNKFLLIKGCIRWILLMIREYLGQWCETFVRKEETVIYYFFPKYDGKVD